jgi:hypothetical protein
MNDQPTEDDENGPDDTTVKSKAVLRSHATHAGASHGHGAHSVVPSTLRGPRAGAARNKIRETLTDAAFDGDGPDKSHLNRR